MDDWFCQIELFLNNNYNKNNNSLFSCSFHKNHIGINKELNGMNENENQCKSMFDCPPWESLFSKVNIITFVDQHEIVLYVNYNF